MFYSNCLIEAIKAKLKNPKNVKVFYIRAKGDIIPHFMWTDGLYDYDFTIVKDDNCNKKLINEIFFKGRIRKCDLGFIEEFKNKRLNE